MLCGSVGLGDVIVDGRHTSEAGMGWNCPESVELNTWVRVFRYNEDKFDADKLVELGKPLSRTS